MVRRARGQASVQDLARIIEEHFAPVYRICRTRTDTIHDAEDALQETFLRFLQADYKRIRNPAAWMWRVSGSACGSLIRAKARRREVDLDAANECAASVDLANGAITRLSLTQVLARLGPSERRTLRWLASDQPMQEIADHLGVSRPTARVIIFRARQNARRARDAMDSTDLTA